MRVLYNHSKADVVPAENAALCIHPGYRQRVYPIHFDDRGMRDEWQEQVYVYARKYARAHDLTRIVDFGCGSGYKLMKHFSGFDTIGFELEPSLSYLQATYPERRWNHAGTIKAVVGDLLICADVVEHMALPHLQNFMEMLTRGPCQTFVLSTPALEILAERGESPRLGPPDNESHIREWTTREFCDFVEMYLRVLDHVVINCRQGTQLILAERK